MVLNWIQEHIFCTIKISNILSGEATSKYVAVIKWPPLDVKSSDIADWEFTIFYQIRTIFIGHIRRTDTFYKVCIKCGSSSPQSSYISVTFDVILSFLKWYYAQFSLQKLGCNSYIFQKIAILLVYIMTNDK